MSKNAAPSRIPPENATGISSERADQLLIRGSIPPSNDPIAIMARYVASPMLIDLFAVTVRSARSNRRVPSLFMVNLVDYLLEREVAKTLGGVPTQPQGALRPNAIDTPPSIVQMIEHVERLIPDDQMVLEAASAAGAEFLSPRWPPR